MRAAKDATEHRLRETRGLLTPAALKAFDGCGPEVGVQLPQIEADSQNTVRAANDINPNAGLVRRAVVAAVHLRLVLGRSAAPAGGVSNAKARPSFNETDYWRKRWTGEG